MVNTPLIPWSHFCGATQFCFSVTTKAWGTSKSRRNSPGASVLFPPCSRVLMSISPFDLLATRSSRSRIPSSGTSSFGTSTVPLPSLAIVMSNFPRQALFTYTSRSYAPGVMTSFELLQSISAELPTSRLLLNVSPLAPKEHKARLTE